MTLDQRAKVLEVSESNCGTREMGQLLKMKTANVISIIKKMDQEKLIKINIVATPKRGRPKKCITITPLGYEFLEAYKKANSKILKAKKEDLSHAEKEALYVNRLMKRGLSPFQVFLELNTIASNIKNSSENHQAI